MHETGEKVESVIGVIGVGTLETEGDLGSGRFMLAALAAPVGFCVLAGVEGAFSHWLAGLVGRGSSSTLLSWRREGSLIPVSLSP